MGLSVEVTGVNAVLSEVVDISVDVIGSAEVESQSEVVDDATVVVPSGEVGRSDDVIGSAEVES